MGSLFEGPQIRNSGINQAIGRLNRLGKQNLKPVSLNAGGLTGSISGGTAKVSSSSARSGLVDQLASTSLNQAGQLAGLRGQVSDAVGGLKATRLQEVENARKSSISNLRDNLARRRILGSSFASDALTRSELEFAQQADKVSAESFLQEIDMKNQLINQEFDARRTAFTTRLDEMNLQADLAAGLSTQANNLLQQSAQLKSQLAMQSAQLQSLIGIQQAGLDAEAQAGAGALFGKIGGSLLGPVGSKIGEEISSSLFA